MSGRFIKNKFGIFYCSVPPKLIEAQRLDVQCSGELHYVLRVIPKLYTVSPGVWLHWREIFLAEPDMYLPDAAEILLMLDRLNNEFEYQDIYRGIRSGPSLAAFRLLQSYIEKSGS